MSSRERTTSKGLVYYLTLEELRTVLIGSQYVIRVQVLATVRFGNKDPWINDTTKYNIATYYPNTTGTVDNLMFHTATENEIPGVVRSEIEQECFSIYEKLTNYA